MKISFKITARKRFFFFVLADAFLIIAAVFLAFLLRFDLIIPAWYFGNVLPAAIILILFFSLLSFYFFRLYSFSWSYVSVEELISLVKAITAAFLLTGVLIFILRDEPFLNGFPRSVLFIAYFLIFIFCGGVRFAKRIYFGIFKRERFFGEKTLIVGAGDAGEQILRNILTSKDSPYMPVGFIDDDPMKKGIIIHGLRILGKIDDIPEIVKTYEAEQMIIAFPSAGSYPVREAVEKGRKAGLQKIKIMPPLSEIIDGQVSLRDLREIQVEDLLKREPISLDTTAIENFIQNKKVLITGAAGSIGAELSKQAAKFKPSLLLILDQDETGIFNIEGGLKSRYPYLQLVSLIADIRDKEKINQIFEEFQPNIIFHAAAYKHVPLMEKNPDEAVKNNIFGTKIIAENSLKYKTDRFVNISTDKAVNPASIMGASKRVGEMICQALNQTNSTRFISVRFGNVLDSRGSVIPIFKERIEKGKPVEITHPEMTRYFMTIPEACSLVMQAAQMGEGGEVFVLDMGDPIKIMDLAKEMIRLSGLEPDKDVPIVFTEPRPGEKFFEEILTAEEGIEATKNQKIFIAKISEINKEKLYSGLEKLEKIVASDNLKREEAKEEVKKILKEIVPSYQPDF